MIRSAEFSDLKTVSECDKHVKYEELENIVKLCRLIVAETDGKVVGWLRWNLFWDNTPFMNMLYVSEEFRGIGYGTALCDFWESEMKRAGYDLVLTSTLSNEKGQFFYRKRGYKDCGSLSLPDEPLEIILMKSLTEVK